MAFQNFIMSTIFLNRATQDGSEWIHIAPRGEFYHADSGMTEVYDEAGERAMVADFANRRSAPNFTGLHLGEEHFIYDPSKSSQAFGWVREIRQAVGDEAPGIWGRVELTDVGQAAIQNRRFKFVSPVHAPGQWEQIDEHRVRPTGIDTIGLTNFSNLRSALVPIRNRGNATSAPDHGNPDAANLNAGNQPHKTTMEHTLKALGLAADATDNDALAAVTALKNRAESAETERNSLRESQVTEDLKRFENRIGKDGVPFWKASLLANRDEAIKALESLPEPETKEPQRKKPGAMLNRGDAGTPKGDPAGDGEPTPQQKARATRIANRASAISREQGIPFASAFRLAEGEMPDSE